MSGIRKCLLNREKKFLIFLKRAGFPLRFFAYVEAGYRKLGYQLSAFAENTGQKTAEKSFVYTKNRDIISSIKEGNLWQKRRLTQKRRQNQRRLQNRHPSSIRG